MWGSPEFYLFSLICLRYQSRWTWLCSETLGKFLPAFHGLVFLLKAKYESQTSLNVVAMGLIELTWTHKKTPQKKNPNKPKQKWNRQTKKPDKIPKGFFVFLNLETKVGNVMSRPLCQHLVTHAGVPQGPVKDRSAEVLFPYFDLYKLLISQNTY